MVEGLVTPVATAAPAVPLRPLVSARGIVKRYGHVTAVDGVDLDIYPGEVLALLGDNGAGKSTLVSIIAGVNQPTEGTIAIDGQPVALRDPSHARDMGIATVFQDLALVEARDVAANLFLGIEPRRFHFLVDYGRMYSEATAAIESLRVSLPSVRVQVRMLSGGQRQAIAVARTVMRGSRLVIMDEPTAALGVREAGKVLDLVKRLREGGHSVLLITHNMDNVFDVANRAVVLRLGRKVAELDVKTSTKQEVVGYVVGSIEGRA